MTASAAVSLFQFQRKYEYAAAHGLDFREYYTPERITGFTSHWMTLSGEEVIVLLILGAMLLSGRVRGWIRAASLGACVVIGASLLLGYTRSMWMGAALGLCYLLAVWRPRWLLAVPVIPLLLLYGNPAGLGDRIRSIQKPAGTLDSNEFRRICRIAGWEIVKAHPILGLGPEGVKRDFRAYIPASVPRPLPDGAYIHLHNVYLQYAAERGLPALIAFLWWLGRMFFDFAAALRRRPGEDTDGRIVLHAAIAVMIAVFSAGWYEHNLGDGEILILFLAVCGCGYSVILGGSAPPLRRR